MTLSVKIFDFASSPERGSFFRAYFKKLRKNPQIFLELKL